MAEEQEQHDPAPPAQEKRTRWSFEVDAGNAWRWHKLSPDGASADSDGRFDTLDACIKDACKRGYGMWIGPDPRKRGAPGAGAGSPPPIIAPPVGSVPAPEPKDE